MKKNSLPKARKTGLVVQDLNGETLIYDLDTHRAVCLNETSALVWQNCDGTKTVKQLGDVLANELKNPTSEDLIWLALDQLKKENLIENKEDLEDKFKGVSRREVIRKVGLGSMIALPIITGLVAPTSVMALTCGGRCNCPGSTPAGSSCGRGTGNTCAQGCTCRTPTTGGGSGEGSCQV
jgi:hypothetical protein